MCLRLSKGSDCPGDGRSTAGSGNISAHRISASRNGQWSRVADARRSLRGPVIAGNRTADRLPEPIAHDYIYAHSPPIYDSYRKPFSQCASHALSLSCATTDCGRSWTRRKGPGREALWRRRPHGLDGE